MKKLICNASGLLFHYKHPHLLVEWISPFTSNHNVKLSRKDSNCLKEILLLETEKLGHGPKICRAICLLLRMRKISSARFLLEQFLTKDYFDAKTNCFVALILCEERKLLHKMFLQKRNKLYFWDLRDIPAWIIPSFIFTLRRKICKNRITILSGNSAFDKEKLLWFVEEKTIIPTRIEPSIFEEITNFEMQN